MKKWPVVASLIMMVIILANACVFIESEPALAPVLTPEVKLSIISQKLTRDETGIPRIQAKIKNVGTSTIGLVEATVEFFDSKGNLIDSSVVTVTNLEPNQTWDCEIVCSGEDCKVATKSEIHVAGTTTERRKIDMGWK
ncbi:FxLYD domain-containing protein [Chloroflexota bacterium]